MNPQFKSYELDAFGKVDVQFIREAFDELLNKLNELKLPDAREFYLCKTRLEESCFFAIKSASMKNDAATQFKKEYKNL